MYLKKWLIKVSISSYGQLRSIVQGIVHVKSVFKANVNYGQYFKLRSFKVNIKSKGHVRSVFKAKVSYRSLFQVKVI